MIKFLSLVLSASALCQAFTTQPRSMARSALPLSSSSSSSALRAELEAILWDMDGVLADTERDGHRLAFNQAFEENSLSTTWDVERYGKLLKIGGGKERMTAHWNEVGWPRNVPRDQRQEMVTDMHARKTEIFMDMINQKKIPLRPGVLRVVDEAIGAGIQMAVCSTSDERAVTNLVQTLMGPERAANFRIFAGDMVPKKKPAPDVYLMAANQMGLDKSRCVIVEDSEIGLQAAKAAGIACIVTKSSYTAGENFMGADMVVDELGDDPATGITLETLAGLLGRQRASPFAQYNPSSFAPSPAPAASQAGPPPFTSQGGPPPFTSQTAPATSSGTAAPARPAAWAAPGAKSPPAASSTPARPAAWAPPAATASPATPATTASNSPPDAPASPAKPAWEPPAATASPAATSTPATTASNSRPDFASPLKPNAEKVPSEIDPDKHRLKAHHPEYVRKPPSPNVETGSSSTDPDKHGLQQLYPSYIRKPPTPNMHTGSSGGDPDKHGLEQLYPSYIRKPPTPNMDTGSSKSASNKRGLKPVYPSYDQAPAAPKGEAGSDETDPDKHGLEPFFPAW